MKILQAPHRRLIRGWLKESTVYLALQCVETASSRLSESVVAGTSFYKGRPSVLRLSGRRKEAKRGGGSRVLGSERYKSKSKSKSKSKKRV